MNSFDKTAEFPVNGRVIDLDGRLITEPATSMDVVLDQKYGDGCLRSQTVPVTDGFFETTLWPMSDDRSFKTKVKLNSGSDYLKIEQHLDWMNYIATSELFLQIQTVNSAERTLAGNLRFRAVSALDFSPVKELSGEYSISSKDTGVFTSNKDGDVYLDHLKVGLTNIIIKDDPDFFNLVINGAKVYKGDTAAEDDAYGRAAMMVTRALDKEMLFSLTWTGANHQLNLMAESFIDSTEGLVSGENCILSFGQPKCIGMEHLSSRDKKVMGETIRLNSNLFYDTEGKLVANKRIMIYVMDTREN